MATPARAQTPSKHWCFTLNNPDYLTPDSADYASGVFLQSILDNWKDPDYVVFKPERGENGTCHFQGYVEFYTPQRLSSLKKMNAQIHWEKRRGTREEARNYVLKEDTAIGTPTEYGKWIPGKIAKTSFSEVVQEMVAGKKVAEIVQEYPEVYARHQRAIMALNVAQTRDRLVPPRVSVFYGPPGCGKSRMARALVADGATLWTQPLGKSGWFDGYLGQRYALMDDFDGKFSGLPLRDLLQLLDRYCLLVPTKGGFTWFEPEEIFITTNFHPRQWYDWSEREQQFPALVRRVTFVYHWRTAKQDYVHKIEPESESWDAWWRGPQEVQRRELGPLDNFVEHPVIDQYNWPGLPPPPTDSQ